MFYTANADGTLAAKVKYTAFWCTPKGGEVRESTGTTPTDYLYTGQLSQMAEIGLYFYVARFYDPYLNHFVQPDSIIPDATNAAYYDRYAYSINNPVNLVDPSGHLSCSAQHVAEGDCSNMTMTLDEYYQTIYNINMEGAWSIHEKDVIRSAVTAVAFKLAEVTGGTSGDAFKRAYDKVTFTKINNDNKYCWGNEGTVNCGSGDGFSADRDNITHELGHTLSWAYNKVPYEILKTIERVDNKGNHVMGGVDKYNVYQRTTLGYKSKKPPYMLHGPSWDDWLSANEDYADMFMNWVNDSFDYDFSANNAGYVRKDWMTANVVDLVASGW